MNNKTYIGAHTTDNLDDGYIGSGKLLLKAIKKYGKDKFTTEIIKFFDSKSEMYKYEAELVNEAYLKTNTYNLKLGGEGGGISNKPRSQETRLKISKSQKGKPKHPGFPDICRKVQTGKKQSKETIAKRAKSISGKNNGLFNRPSNRRNPIIWDNIDKLYELWISLNKPKHGIFKSKCVELGYPDQSYQKVVMVFQGKMKYIKSN